MNIQEINLELDGKTPSQIKEFLESYCYTKEDASYFRQFSDDERHDVSELFLKDSIEAARIEEELAEIKKDYKARLDPIKNNIKNMRTELKNNGREEFGVLYLIDDYENGMMHNVDANGNVISSRKMTVKERQLHTNSNVKPFTKTA